MNPNISHPKTTVRTCLLVAGLLGNLAIAQGGPATFQGLGMLPGSEFEYSCPYAVSADGSVVVGQSWGLNGLQAFRWTPTTGIVGLDRLQGDTVNNALGVSADGAVVVGSSQIPTRASSVAWTPNGGPSPVGDPSIHGVASGISADGSVVVGFGSGAGAYRWTQADGVIDLGPGFAAAVSADGSVVVGGGMASPGYQTEAFRWTQQDGMVGLGTIPGGPPISFARAVSGDGAVVVGGIGGGHPEQGFRWSQSTGMVGIGCLPGGTSSDAYGVSGDGSVVVGRAYSDSSGEEAFIWDQQHGIRKLRDVLIGEYGLNLDGWKPRTAYAISPDGMTIVGYADHGSSGEGFIVRLPEPAPALLLGLGVAGLLQRRR